MKRVRKIIEKTPKPSTLALDFVPGVEFLVPNVGFILSRCFLHPDGRLLLLSQLRFFLSRFLSCHRAVNNTASDGITNMRLYIFCGNFSQSWGSSAMGKMGRGDWVQSPGEVVKCRMETMLASHKATKLEITERKNGPHQVVEWTAVEVALAMCWQKRLVDVVLHEGPKKSLQASSGKEGSSKLFHLVLCVLTTTTPQIRWKRPDLEQQ